MTDQLAKFELKGAPKVIHGQGGAPAGRPSGDSETATAVPDTKDKQIVDYVIDCISSGEKYRDQFKPKWNEILSQVACEHPSQWDKKESWQSKVFVGLQSKTSETVKSKVMRLLFPRKFFGLNGYDDSDKEMIDELVSLITAILEKGGFYKQNTMAVEEAGEIGTSALKIWCEDKKHIKFQWRSCFNWVIDPSCRGEVEKKKWWADEYEKDISEIIAEAKKKGGLYSKSAVQKLLDILSSECKDKSKEDLSYIRGLDGTAEILVPKALKKVILHEFWGKVKVPKKKKSGDDWIDTGEYELQDRVITIANRQIELRNDENPYGYIPVVFARLKKRRYDFYAKGYIFNTLDIQELLNSTINLGFDSLKINSMDIIKLDVNKVDDPNSIEYKPLAIWRLRDVNGAELQRGNTGVSALLDILRGAQYLDQIHQDISGISRHAQGAQTLQGQGGAETLGEYQLKLQNVEERFLGEVSFLENEYIVPLVQMIYGIIKDKNLFSQDAINDILGMEQRAEEIQDPITGQVQVQQYEVPKLLQEQLAERDFTNNFAATGVTALADNTESFARLQKLMQTIFTNPQLFSYLKVDTFLKRVMQALQMPEWEDMIMDEQEMQGKLQQVMQQQQQMGGAGQGGA